MFINVLGLESNFMCEYHSVVRYVRPCPYYAGCHWICPRTSPPWESSTNVGISRSSGHGHRHGLLQETSAFNAIKHWAVKHQSWHSWTISMLFMESFFGGKGVNNEWWWRMVKIDMLNIHWWEVVSWIVKQVGLLIHPGTWQGLLKKYVRWKDQNLWTIACVRMSLKKFVKMIVVEEVFIFMIEICCFDLVWWDGPFKPMASLVSQRFLYKKRATFVWPLIRSDPNFLRLDPFRRTNSVQRRSWDVSHMEWPKRPRFESLRDAAKVTGSRVLYLEFRMSSKCFFAAFWMSSSQVNCFFPRNHRTKQYTITAKKNWSSQCPFRFLFTQWYTMWFVSSGEVRHDLCHEFPSPRKTFNPHGHCKTPILKINGWNLKITRLQRKIIFQTSMALCSSR